MRYRPNILALYDQLFDETHVGLLKEAGREGIVARLSRRFLSNPRRVAAAEQAAEQAMGQSGRMEQAVSDASHRMGLMEADLSTSRSAQEQLKQQLAAREGEIRRLGTEPGEVTRLHRNAMIGGGLGLAGLAAAPIAYGAGHRQGEGDMKRTRNVAFGAGAATGLAAPHLIRGLGQIARGVGQTGLYPEAGELGMAMDPTSSYGGY